MDRPFTTFRPAPQCLGRTWLALAITPVVSGVFGTLLSGGSAPVGFTGRGRSHNDEREHREERDIGDQAQVVETLA